MDRPRKKEILEQLRLEREILAKGGYAHSLRLPWKTPQFFRDSVTCLNYEEVVRKHPCTGCVLIDFVPPGERTRDVPCHHIPLNERGDTIATLDPDRNRGRVEMALLDWLDTAIAELEESQTAGN